MSAVILFFFSPSSCRSRVRVRVRCACVRACVGSFKKKPEWLGLLPRLSYPVHVVHPLYPPDQEKRLHSDAGEKKTCEDLQIIVDYGIIALKSTWIESKHASSG